MVLKILHRGKKKVMVIRNVIKLFSQGRGECFVALTSSQEAVLLVQMVAKGGTDLIDRLK